MSSGRRSPQARPGWIVLLGCASVGSLVGFLWLADHTSSPPLASAVVIMVAVGALLIGPWAMATAATTTTTRCVQARLGRPDRSTGT